MKIRYIRWYSAGSSSNTSNHIVELQAFEGVINRASGIVATSNYGSASNLNLITDGSNTSSPYCSFGTATGNYYIQIDLGGIYNIDTIKALPYWSDGRTYYSTRLQTSQDGIHWVSPYDSAIHGTFVATSSGKTIDCSNFFTINGFDFPLYDTANVPRVKVGTKYLQLTTDPTLSFNVSGDKRFVADPNGSPLYIQCLPSRFTSWTTSQTTSQSTTTSWTTSKSTTTSWTTSYTTSWSTGETEEHGDYFGWTSWNTSKTTNRTTNKSTTTSQTTSQSTTTSWTTSITTGKTVKQGGWI
jgi:hypothetical protein